MHGEADACPSLVCDRYDRWLVVQLLSAGLEAFRAPIVDALREALSPDGILARHDVPVRKKEGLATGVELLAGDVPQEIEVNEHGVRYLAAPWTGQKTGAFLDQRENRVMIGERARGRALDCFSYHGSFALHLARRAESVVAVDVSGDALKRAEENAARNELTNIRFVEADVFDYLREVERSRERFDTIVVDPPAFAKTRASVPGALRGYKDVNLRALRVLAPGGLLFTASCSFHVGRAEFFEMLRSAAADSGRRVALRAMTGQPIDHPEIMTIPETGYLKGALARSSGLIAWGSAGAGREGRVRRRSAENWNECGGGVRRTGTSAVAECGELERGRGRGAGNWDGCGGGVRGTGTEAGCGGGCGYGSNSWRG